MHLLLVITAGLLGSELLALVAARAATAEWALDAKVNVLGRVDAHNKGRHVDELLAHTVEKT